MKSDILTIAVVVFFVGVLVSSVGFSKTEKEPKEEQVRSELHQGVTLR